MEEILLGEFPVLKDSSQYIYLALVKARQEIEEENNFQGTIAGHQDERMMRARGMLNEVATIHSLEGQHGVLAYFNTRGFSDKVLEGLDAESAEEAKVVTSSGGVSDSKKPDVDLPAGNRRAESGVSLSFAAATANEGVFVREENVSDNAIQLRKNLDAFVETARRINGLNSKVKTSLDDASRNIAEAGFALGLQ